MITLNKIKIIEYNKYHYEILPTWIYILSQIDEQKTVELFFNFESIKRSITDFFNVDIDQKSVSLFSSKKKKIWKIIRFPFKFFIQSIIGAFRYPDINDNLFLRVFLRKKTILIFNTIEPLKVFEKAYYFAKRDFKLIVVLHNGDLVNDKTYRDLLNLKNVIVFSLSEMVLEYLKSKGIKNTKLISPVFFKYDKLKKKNTGITLTVQGTVTFSRRNYTYLIRVIEELVNEKRLSDFKVEILGNSNNSEGNIVIEEVKKRKLENYFTFYDTTLDYRSFYNKIEKSDFLLVLQDKSSFQYYPYFKYKCSEAINVSLGFGKIMIIHEEQMRANKLEGLTITYSEKGLKDAIMKAVELSPEKRESIESLIIRKRDKLLNTSLSDVRKVLF